MNNILEDLKNDNLEKIVTIDCNGNQIQLNGNFISCEDQNGIFQLNLNHFTLSPGFYLDTLLNNLGNVFISKHLAQYLNIKFQSSHPKTFFPISKPKNKVYQVFSNMWRETFTVDPQVFPLIPDQPLGKTLPLTEKDFFETFKNHVHQVQTQSFTKLDTLFIDDFFCHLQSHLFKDLNWNMDQIVGEYTYWTKYGCLRNNHVKLVNLANAIIERNVETFINYLEDPELVQYLIEKLQNEKMIDIKDLYKSIHDFCGKILEEFFDKLTNLEYFEMDENDLTECYVKSKIMTTEDYSLLKKFSNCHILFVDKYIYWNEDRLKENNETYWELQIRLKVTNGILDSLRELYYSINMWCKKEDELKYLISKFQKKIDDGINIEREFYEDNCGPLTGAHGPLKEEWASYNTTTFQYKWYYENGQLGIQKDWLNEGHYNYKVTEWHENGVLKTVYTLLDDKYDGELKMYFDNGVLQVDSKYEMNKRVYFKEYSREGKLVV